MIHTVGPVWDGGEQGEAELRASAYRNSLRVAEEHHVCSLAFPSISTGVYGYPIAEAARIALERQSPTYAAAVHCGRFSSFSLARTTWKSTNGHWLPCSPRQARLAVVDDDEPDRSEQLRHAILRVLERRFGTVPAAIVEWVSQMTAQNGLMRLLEYAVTVQTLDELAEHIRAM